MDVETRSHRKEILQIRRDFFADRKWPRRLRDARRFVVQHPRSILLSLGGREALETLQAFCLFVGHGRSGSTLVGSLLDAHPEIVLGQELDALWYVSSRFRRSQIFSLIRRNSGYFTEQGRNWEGYSFQVPGQWQGRSSAIKVIGDKKASVTALRLLFAPELLHRTRKTTGLPLKLIQVVRNPYDNIATLVRRWTRHECADEESGKRNLRMAIQHYFISAQIVERLRQSGEDIWSLRLEDLAANPHEQLRGLCGFLGVEANAGFLDACAGIVWKKPRQTRTGLPWDDDLIDLVRSRSRPYELLRSYTF